jgi:hypothetical protein
MSRAAFGSRPLLRLTMWVRVVMMMWLLKTQKIQTCSSPGDQCSVFEWKVTSIMNDRGCSIPLSLAMFLPRTLRVTMNMKPENNFASPFMLTTCTILFYAPLRPKYWHIRTVTTEHPGIADNYTGSLGFSSLTQDSVKKLFVSTLFSAGKFLDRSWDSSVV